MADNNAQGLRIFYGEEDPDHLWRRIVTDIKIRKFNNLDTVHEFRELPNELQNEIGNNVKNDNDYKRFSSKQYFNSSYAILFTNKTEKWIAIFQEKRMPVNIRALIMSVLIIGVLYIWMIFKSRKQNSNEFSANNSLKDIISYFGNTLFRMISIVLPLPLAFYLFKKWLLARELKYNELVEACMLQKLQTLTNS